ncbi:MAG: Fur family transcriptional regulator [Bacillota bacterium]
MKIRQRAEKILKKYNIRLTKQRCSIMGILLQAARPLSAAEIHKGLSQNGEKIRLSTIYRNLNKFNLAGVLKEINPGRMNKEKLYELMLEGHHHHLVCTDCGKIIPLDCPLEGYESKIAAKTGFRINDHSVNFYGICPECLDKNQKNI